MKNALINISVGCFCCGDGLESSWERRLQRIQSEVIKANEICERYLRTLWSFLWLPGKAGLGRNVADHSTELCSRVFYEFLPQPSTPALNAHAP